jgi:hypothetical protein
MTTESPSSDDEQTSTSTDGDVSSGPDAPRRRRAATAPAASSPLTPPSSRPRSTERPPADTRASSPTWLTSQPTNRRVIGALAILAVLGLIGTIAFAVAWQHADNRTPSTIDGGPKTGEVRDAATNFSRALTNFDGATVDRDFGRIISLSTGGFSDQADQFFSTKTRKDLKEAQASSRGEVRSAYVQEISGTRASVFVVVDQTIANNKAPQPRADTLRMELKLEQKSGTWKVSNVEVLTAPVDGSGLPGASVTTTTGG